MLLFGLGVVVLLVWGVYRAQREDGASEHAERQCGSVGAGGVSSPGLQGAYVEGTDATDGMKVRVVGYVQTMAGRPVASARIFSVGLSQETYTSSGEDGSYALSLPAVAGLRVAAVVSGKTVFPAEVGVLSGDAAREPLRIDFYVTDASSLSGRVCTASGSPVSGATVSFSKRDPAGFSLLGWGRAIETWPHCAPSVVTDVRGASIQTGYQVVSGSVLRLSLRASCRRFRKASDWSLGPVARWILSLKRQRRCSEQSNWMTTRFGTRCSTSRSFAAAYCAVGVSFAHRKKGSMLCRACLQESRHTALRDSSSERCRRFVSPSRGRGRPERTEWTYCSCGLRNVEFETRISA